MCPRTSLYIHHVHLLMVGILILGRGSVDAVAQSSPKTDAVETAKNGEGVHRRAISDPTGPALPSISPSVSGNSRVIYVWQDEQKQKLVPVVDWTLADFDRLVRQQERAEAASPAYVLTSLQIKAQAEKEQLVLDDIRVGIRLLTDRWHSIPLHLTPGVLVAPPVLTSGKGDIEIRKQEETNGGYQLWIKGEAGSDCEVQLKMVCRLQSIGRETIWKMSLPLASRAELRITLPEATYLESSPNLLISETEPTKWLVRGFDHELKLSWRPRQTDTPKANELFKVDGEIDVIVDDFQGTVTADASLNITTFQERLHLMTIRLPSNYHLVESDYGDYVVRPLENSAVPGYVDFQIQFDDGAIQSAVVRLKVQIDPNSGDYSLADFDVVGALAQTGIVNLYSNGDWRFVWTLDPSARRIGERDGNSTAKARFEYFKPNQIHLALLREKPLLTVEPTYLLDMQEAECRLTAVFSYRSLGPNADAVKLDLGDWEFLDIGPNANVRTAEVGRESVSGGDGDQQSVPSKKQWGPLVVPLTSGLPADFRIRLTARRPLEPKLVRQPSNLDLILPIPVQSTETSLLPATVVIVGAPNVRAQLQDPSMESTYILNDVPELLRTEMGSPALAPLSFRTSIDRAMKVPLQASKLERVMNVEGETEILEWNDTHLRIRQRFRLQVDFVPLPQFSVMVSELIDQDLQIKVNGAPIQPYSGVTSFTSSEMMIPLPSPSWGTFDVVIDYQVRVARLGNSPEMDVPLIVPRRFTANAAISGMPENFSYINQFLRPTTSRFRVILPPNRNRPWEPESYDSTSTEPTSAQVLAKTTEIQDKITVTLLRVESQVTPEQFDLTIDRAWFQSWCTNADRYERAVFSIHGHERPIQIRLPKHVNAQQVKFMVDGRIQQDFTPISPEEVEIALPSGNQESHVVEVIYRTTRQRLSPLRFAAPRIVDANMSRTPWYWHLVIPKNESVVGIPGELTPAYQWTWSGWFPKKKFDKDQSALEAWCKSSPSERSVLFGATQYVFGAFGPTEAMEIRTMSTPLILVLCSGAALTLGILIIYAQSRHRLILLIPLAIVFVSFVWINPTWASLLAQSAVLGLVLAILAATLSWLLRQTEREAWRKRVHSSHASSVGAGGPAAQDSTTRRARVGSSHQHETIEPVGR